MNTLKIPVNPIVKTRSLQEACAALDEMRKNRATGQLVGVCGIGKTCALRAYAARANTPGANSAVLTYRPETINTPRSLVRGLLWALDVPFDGSSGDGYRVCLKLIQHAGVELIVVDDAQRQARHTMDMVRALHETAGVAVALAGPPHLPHLVDDKCPELSHRMHAVHEMGLLRPADVRVLLSELSVLSGGRAVVERKQRLYWEAIALSRALVRESGGNFWRLLEILRMARALARRQHRPLTARLVAQAAAGWLVHLSQRSA